MKKEDKKWSKILHINKNTFCDEKKYFKMEKYLKRKSI